MGLANDGTPVIVMRATATDEAVAIDTVHLATDALQEQLESRQSDAGAPEEIRIRAIVLTDPGDADLLVGDRIRAFIVVLAIGVAASISMAFLAESIAQASSRRRGDGETGDGETGDGETGDGQTGDGETGDGETGDGQTREPTA